MGKRVDEGTIIQFNLKWFIGIIITVISFFITFYFVVQKPNNDSIKEYMDTKMTTEREYQDLKYEKLDEIVIKLDDLDQKVDALSKRNNSDLNDLRSTINNSGASLGN